MTTWFERFPSPAIYRQVVLEHICGNKSGARELLENGFITADEWVELRDHISHEQSTELHGRERWQSRGAKKPWEEPEAALTKLGESFNSLLGAIARFRDKS